MIRFLASRLQVLKCVAGAGAGAGGPQMWPSEGMWPKLAMFPESEPLGCKGPRRVLEGGSLSQKEVPVFLPHGRSHTWV